MFQIVDIILMGLVGSGNVWAILALEKTTSMKQTKKKQVSDNI